MTFTGWLILSQHTSDISKFIESLLYTAFYINVKGVKVVNFQEEFELSTPLG